MTVEQVFESCTPDLVDALQKWRRWLTSERNMSKHTLRAYTHDVSQFITFLAQHHGCSVSLNELAGADLKDFRAWMSRKAIDGAGVASRARSLSGVKNLLTWMDRHGVLHNAAIKTVRNPKQPRRLPRPLYEKQAITVLDEAGGEEDWVHLRDRALFTMLYGCGLRIDEALSLDISGLPVEGFVRVTGKGRRERVVPVLKQVEDAVNRYRAACPFPETSDRPLFLGEMGKRLHQGVAQKAMRDLRRGLGLPENATPHALRHSFATHLLQNGVNLREIQELLGHASLSTTQIYTEMDGKKLLEEYSKAFPTRRE